MTQPVNGFWTWALVFRSPFWPLRWPPLRFRSVEGDMPAELEANEKALKAAIAKEKARRAGG